MVLIGGSELGFRGIDGLEFKGEMWFEAKIVTQALLLRIDSEKARNRKMPCLETVLMFKSKLERITRIHSGFYRPGK